MNMFAKDIKFIKFKMANIQEEVEDKIIDWIALDTGGRLIAIKPEGGADLIVQKKGGHGGKEILFKVEAFISAQEEKDLKKGIDLSEVKVKGNFYFLIVVFSEVKQAVSEKIWLVPSSEMSSQFDSEKYSKFLTDKKKLISFLIQNLILENKPKPHAGFKRKVC